MTITEHPSALSADGVLVRAYLAGDDAAFTTLYDDYYQRLVRFLFRQVHDETIAQDLAQDAFERALRYLGTYDAAMPFWPWLKKIATNLLPAEQHRRAVELPADEADGEMLTLPDTTENVVTTQAVMECLRMLPSRQQRALVWRYVEDRETADIAELLGLKRNAVEQLMLRARQGFGKEYRARNSASFAPGFAGLVARFRRLVGAVVSRISGASTTTMSMAGDWAVAGAVAVSGLGIGLGMVPDIDREAGGPEVITPPAVVKQVDGDAPIAKRPSTVAVATALDGSALSIAVASTTSTTTATAVPAGDAAAPTAADPGAGDAPAPPQGAPPTVQTGPNVPPPPQPDRPQIHGSNAIENKADVKVESEDSDADGDGKGQETDVIVSIPDLGVEKTLIEYESEGEEVPDVPLL